MRTANTPVSRAPNQASERAERDEEGDRERAAGGDEPCKIEALAVTRRGNGAAALRRARTGTRSALDSSPAGHAAVFAAAAGSYCVDLRPLRASATPQCV